MKYFELIYVNRAVVLEGDCKIKRLLTSESNEEAMNLFVYFTNIDDQRPLEFPAKNVNVFFFNQNSIYPKIYFDVWHNNVTNFFCFEFL